MPELEHVAAAAVRAERSRLHLRQADLGSRLHWTVSQVSALELGRRAIHLGDLPGLCQALDVGLEDLLRRADGADLQALRIARL